MTKSETKKQKNRVVVDNPGSGGLWRVIKILVLLGVLLAIGGGITAGVLLADLKEELPTFRSVDEYRPLLGTSVYSYTGERIADFAIEKREPVPYHRIPPKMILAFLAAEDRNFFTHFGLDPYYIVRAAWKNVSAGHFKEGASTITMQLARTFFLSREKKLIRKLKEILLAVFELEGHLTKEEILYLYLNQIYLGHGCYGVQEAAKGYFSKNVWELDLAEMAVLAGMPKAPGRDSPYVNMERAYGRRAYVLRRMLEENFISKAEHDRAVNEPITLNEEPDPFLRYAPHYSEHIRKYIYDTYGEKALYEGGLMVGTAMQLDAQKYAQEALAIGLRSLDHREGYRGPIGHLQKDRREAFIKQLAEMYKNARLDRERIYFGVVTKVDDKRERVTVSAGKWTGDILLETMRWARKPNPEVAWEWALVRKPSQVLSEGDVIYVRPTDRDALKGEFDYRSDKPLSGEELLWVLEQTPSPQSAILSKEVDSGYVIAMVGGYDFEQSEFNRAVQACRQPGSAFKPIVYTAAIDKGWTVSTIIVDAPIVAGEWKTKWKPENYGEDFKGEVSLRYALQNSLNIPAIKTLDYVGVHKLKEYAEKMGIRTKIQEDRSISLGSACVTVADIVNVFATFPRMGREPRTVYVTHIIDRDGNYIEDNRVYYDITLDAAEKLPRMIAELERQEAQVIDQKTAYIMTWLLNQVVKGGTGMGALALGRESGGKTGTTNDSYDAWYVGFTPDVVTGVWIGHDDNSRPLGVRETGGRAALPIWLDYMKHVMKGRPKLDFEEPEGISWIQVHKKTGRRAIEGATQTMRAPFKPGTAPDEVMVLEGEQDPEELYKMIY